MKFEAFYSGTKIGLNYTAYASSDCSPGVEAGPFTAVTFDSTCQSTDDTIGKVVKSFPPLSKGHRDIT